MAQTVTLTQRPQDATTREETFDRMVALLSHIVPEAELMLKADLAFEINQLKREKNAVILGHNYMEAALFHSVPDYVGDSLQLASLSTKTKADIIVFCGVQFMGETAKVLNPNKTVLIPAQKAGCSLAEGITVENIRTLKRIYPGAPVITYVNTYADAKAESDCCCTSGNAGAVVRHFFNQGCDRVIFLPDDYLAHNTARELGAAYVKAPESLDGLPENFGVEPGRLTIIGWRAHCEVHELFKVDDVLNIRKQFPDAIILAHPECAPDVIDLCDVTGSTKTMVDYLRDVDAPRYALLTECAMADNLAAEFPHREVLRLCSLRCKHMNLITLEDTLESLKKKQYEVLLAPDIIERAYAPIKRMIDIR
jgi:quinolinate synthase